MSSLTNQPPPSDPRLQSAKRIASLLCAIGGWGALVVLVLDLLHVPGVTVFWLLLFLPMLLPSGAFLSLHNRHVENGWHVVLHLKDTPPLLPSFWHFAAACLADGLVFVMAVLLPILLTVARTAEWASRRAAASEGSWVPWSLAMAAGWIFIFAIPIYLYLFWLPSTRLQARPGFWLLGLRMTDLEGHRLTRRAMHAKTQAESTDPDAEVEERPTYLIVRRPMENAGQPKLEEMGK